jgi:hypothetical protein
MNNFIFYLEMKPNYGLFANFILSKTRTKSVFQPETGKNFLKNNMPCAGVSKFVFGRIKFHLPKRQAFNAPYFKHWPVSRLPRDQEFPNACLKLVCYI